MGYVCIDSFFHAMKADAIRIVLSELSRERSSETSSNNKKASSLLDKAFWEFCFSGNEFTSLLTFFRNQRRSHDVDDGMQFHHYGIGDSDARLSQHDTCLRILQR